MRQRSIVALVVVTSCLLGAGCGSIAEMTALMKETEPAADALEKELGTRPLIAGNVINGSLTVNVIIDSERVQQMQVADLEVRVHKALAAVMTKRPQQVLVSLRAMSFKTGTSVGRLASPDRSRAD